jgi:predicted secreted protein
MSGSGSRYWWIAGLLLCLPLAACDDSAPEKSAGGKSATAPRKPQVTDNMVAAVSSGKTATAVGVYFTLGAAPALDTALPVDVAILPHQDFSSLQARFKTQGDGLTLVSGQSFPPTANAKAEKALEHKLVLMPKKEGIYMVIASLETEGSEGSMSRIFSIPVIVAPPAPAAAEPAAATPEPAPTTH